ncbi:MAG: hypothetical protein PHT58_06330 [Eubacteriales bacterium]|nr:hypothetical protein [Eubacteriales bacterium]
MVLMAVGIILMLAGAGSFFYGCFQNNDLGSQIESLFSKGIANPGDIWIYIGVTAFVIGIILTIAGAIKKYNEE